MMLYKNTKTKFHSPDGDTGYFNIVAGALQGDTSAPYLFIICLDYVLRTSNDLMKKKKKKKKKRLHAGKKRSIIYPAQTITVTYYADDIALLANTPALASPCPIVWDGQQVA